MDPQLLVITPIFARECHYVGTIEHLPAKVRCELVGDYKCDLFYRSSTGAYANVVFKSARRVIGWDNAPRHRGLSNFPHHFHREDGMIITSALTGNPASDIVIVAKEINAFWRVRVFEI